MSHCRWCRFYCSQPPIKQRGPEVEDLLCNPFPAPATAVLHAARDRQLARAEPHQHPARLPLVISLIMACGQNIKLSCCQHLTFAPGQRALACSC